MELLAGRHAVVFGSGTPVGAAVANAFTTAGASVVYVDEPDRVGDLRAANPQSAVLEACLNDEDSIASSLANAVERFGPIDVLFTGAHYAQAGDLGVAAIDRDVWDQTYSRVVRSVALTIMHATEHFAASAVVVNTTSMAAFAGGINHLAFATASAAVESLTIHAATQLAPRGVRCNAVKIGPIDRGGPRLPDEAMRRVEALRRQILLGRLGSPEEAARVVLFLASEQSSFMTGQVLAVDGGVLVHQPHVEDIR